jgi:cell division topological specificity factor
MLDLLQRILGKETGRASKNVATERLRLVLMHDRMDLTPQMMDSLRSDILKVITDYLEIDETNMEISFHRDKGSIALVASIPVVKMKRLPTCV